MEQGFNMLQTLNESLDKNELNILIVEDNPGDVLIITELLKSSSIQFSFKTASTVREFLAVCSHQEFDVILLDLGLPDSDGLETLKKIQLINVIPPVIVMTGLDDEDIALASLREGAQDYLVKNRLTSENILQSIKYGIERKKLHDLQKKNTRQFTILSNTTAALNESEEIASIYQIICENIRLLIEKGNAFSVEIKDKKIYRFSNNDWLEPWYENLFLMTSTDHENNRLLDLFSDGKLHKVEIGFFDLITGVFNRKPNSVPEKSMIIKNLYCIGFIRNEKIYGGVIIFSSKMIEDDEIKIIEAISNQVSLSIHRRSIEKDLKSSETQYKNLAEELELKVRERTSELENMNFLLNQELNERNIAEQALKKSEARLRELNATKDKFFNIVAHDLKNPFTSLLGSTELLFDNIQHMDNEQIKKLAQILNDSAKGGYAILQNLLDWSRSQTGLLKFTPQRVNMKNLIDENILNMHLFAANKEINLNTDIDKDLFILADKNMMNTIVRNLLNNAVKFTHRGGKVDIKVFRNGNEVTVSVKDNGVGISARNINKLFRIDTKYQVPGTDKEQGTGLGLKICKEFIEKHNGKIWVKSSLNKGSEFIFTIPV